MAASKPLLIPWLIEQIDSGRYPGVHWTNQERTEFCIPWKHGLRQDSSVDDVRIFRAWAEKSSSTNRDATVWKRNFRSALRAKSCEKVSDNRNDPANPNKVFRLPKEYQQRVTQQYRDTEPVPPQNHVPHFDSPTADRPVEGIACAGSEYFSSPNGFSPDMDKDLLERCLMGMNLYEPQQVIMQPSEVMSPVMIPEPQQTSVEAMDTHFEPPRVELPQMGAAGVNCTLGTQFRVIAYYRGKKVLEKQVESEGFVVLFRPANLELLGHPPAPNQELTPIYLPGTDQVKMFDKKQAELTQRILENLGDGLEVGVSGPAVYGLRRGGECKIYWSDDKFPESNIPQELRKEPQTLHSMTDFIPGLLDFINGGKKSPSCSLFFCLGEKWPDTEQKPWEKKLVMLEVIITTSELLKLYAVDGGASSLESVQLQFSNNPSLTSRDFLQYIQNPGNFS